MNNMSDKLIVNATQMIGNLTGVGQVVAEISKRLALDFSPDVDFYTPLKTFSDYHDLIDGTSSVRSLSKMKGLFKYLPFKETVRKGLSSFGSCANDYDIYWEPNFIPLSRIRSKRLVTTVHDMSFHENPEWQPRDRMAYFAENFFTNIDRSDVVVSVSEFSRQRFLESQDKVREDRVKVIPNGIDHNLFKVYDAESVSKFKIRYDLPDSFFLFVGTMEPRKNLLHLLTAYGELPDDIKNDFPLVLAGDVGWKNKKIFSSMERLKGHVQWLGYLNDRIDLAMLYNAATIFVYPSLYEGFGIPPLEAMACGTPVCLSSIPVFHEVFGDAAAIYFDPSKPTELTYSLERLIQDNSLRGKLILRGLALSKRYSWDNSYAEYVSLFEAL
jgi:glycosyltransferase involved in cell wall biosynthesis